MGSDCQDSDVNEGLRKARKATGRWPCIGHRPVNRAASALLGQDEKLWNSTEATPRASARLNTVAVPKTAIGRQPA